MLSDRKAGARISGTRRLVPLALAGVLLTSCAAGSFPTSTGVVETHEAMNRWIDQASVAIWDVRSGARSPTEGLDPALMADADWRKLREASRSLEVHARRMADARSVRVGPRTGESSGFASGSEIQSRIDADPLWFRKLSLQMAEHARDLNAAAGAKNPRRASDLIESMNDTCQTCHTRYWAKAAF